MEKPTGDTSSNIEDAVDRIGASVFGEMHEPTEAPGIEEIQAEPEKPVAQAPLQEAAPSQEVPQAYDPPKSWKKEMHGYWTKLDPTVQGYFIEREKQLLDGFQSFRPIQEAVRPHIDFLRRIGVPPERAIDVLLRAQARLTEGPIEQRRAAYKELGKNLQLLEEAAQQAQAQQAPVDPVVQRLEQKLSGLESVLFERQQREVEDVRKSVQKEVDTFAADTKAHPYFDEVATDIASFVSLGMSLQDAYEKAVWANPATRQKELTRVQTEHEAKLKENARLTSLPKKRAAGVNLKSNGEGAAPTGPVGSLEDTIREAHREIRQRAS